MTDSAFDKAKAASYRNTGDRLKKVENRQQLDAEEPATFIYEGHDPATGNSLIRKPGSCCCPPNNPASYNNGAIAPPSGTTARGTPITTSSFSKGEVVMPREVEGGNVRIDKVPKFEEPQEIEEPQTQPRAGEIAPPESECEGCIGFAYVYPEYTGGVNDDGTYETEIVRIPDDKRCVDPNNPNRPLNPEDLGCVKPGEPLGRCQWYELTENFEAPEGMFRTTTKTGADGKEFGLYCTEDCSPAEVEGVGYDAWSPENVSAKGNAVIGDEYCDGAATGELIWDDGRITSENPPIRIEQTFGGTQISFYVTFVFAGDGFSGQWEGWLCVVVPHTGVVKDSDYVDTVANNRPLIDFAPYYINPPDPTWTVYAMSAVRAGNMLRFPDRECGLGQTWQSLDDGGFPGFENFTLYTVFYSSNEGFFGIPVLAVDESQITSHSVSYSNQTITPTEAGWSIVDSTGEILSLDSEPTNPCYICRSNTKLC